LNATVPVGAFLYAGGCQLFETYCFGDTYLEVIANSTGEVVATNTYGPTGCGVCSFVNYTNLGLVTTRRRLFAVETQFTVRINCTRYDANCGGVFAVQVVLPPEDRNNGNSESGALKVVLASAGAAAGTLVIALCAVNYGLCKRRRKLKRERRKERDLVLAGGARPMKPKVHGWPRVISL